MTDQKLMQSLDSLSLGSDSGVHPALPEVNTTSKHELHSFLPRAPHDNTGFSPFGPPQEKSPYPRLHPLFSGTVPSTDATDKVSYGKTDTNPFDLHGSVFNTSSPPPNFSAGARNLPFCNSTWTAPAATSAFGPGSERPLPNSQPLQLGTTPSIRFGNNIPAPSNGENDIIPTAIVIKNIPFNIKREQLLHVIRDLGIPVPYAFNYHFDQGIFRGLAFANFHTPAEADEVVSALNGLDVSGRKLRVEYKKVLQAGEKERIEKEKAIKRMQFPHQDKAKKDKGLSVETGAPLGLSPGMPPRISSPNLLGTHRRSPDHGSAFFPKAVDASDALDLNDAGTLEIYSRVLLFKDDRMRDELAFSKNFTAAERRVVHLVAQKLRLFHYTIGTGDERYVLVTKREMPQHVPSNALDTHLLNDRSLRGNLTTKKSAPDMKRALDDRASNLSNRHLLTPGGALSARNSNSSLHDHYAFAADRRFDGFGHFGQGTAAGNLFTYPVDVPPVPLLARPTSVDIERLDQYHQTVPPTQLRVRSPFAGASTPVSPIGPQTSGPLDHIPFGMDLPLRPLATRNIPVDLSVDARNATFSHSNRTSPSSSLGPDTSSPSHLVPPTITKTPISDEPL